MYRLRVLGIVGSPRKGNSEYLLKQSLEAAESYAPGRIEIEQYSFRNKKFNPCIGCNYCIRHEGPCFHNDDFQELKEKWIEADAIIYSLAVYHMGMPGQVKCFIDRLGNSMFGSHRVILPDGTETLAKQYKAIGTIAQGIHIFSGQEHTITQMINHALLMQSVPVAGDLWEAYIGAGGWTRNRIGLHAMEELAEEQEFSTHAALRAARQLGKRTVEMTDIILSGLEARKDILSGDPLYQYIIDRLEKKQKYNAGNG